MACQGRVKSSSIKQIPVWPLLCPCFPRNGLKLLFHVVCDCLSQPCLLRFTGGNVRAVRHTPGVSEQTTCWDTWSSDAKLHCLIQESPSSQGLLSQDLPKPTLLSEGSGWKVCLFIVLHQGSQPTNSFLSDSMAQPQHCGR